MSRTNATENQERYFPRLSLFLGALGTPTLTGALNGLATLVGYGFMHACRIAPQSHPQLEAIATSPTSSQNATRLPGNSSNITFNITTVPQSTNQTIYDKPWSVCERAHLGITTPMNFAVYTMTASTIAYCLYALLVTTCIICKTDNNRIIQQTVINWFRIALATNIIAGPVSGSLWAFTLRCMPIYNAAQWMGAPFFGHMIFCIIACFIVAMKQCASRCLYVSQEEEEDVLALPPRIRHNVRIDMLDDGAQPEPTPVTSQPVSVRGIEKDTPSNVLRHRRSATNDYSAEIPGRVPGANS